MGWLLIDMILAVALVKLYLHLRDVKARLEYTEEQREMLQIQVDLLTNRLDNVQGELTSIWYKTTGAK